MEIGIVGLGRMGGNIARRLMKGGHKVAVFDKNPDAMRALASEGAKPADSLRNMVTTLKAPRVVWIMLPSGAVTENAINELSCYLTAEDTVIDGGNTYYKDDVRRAGELKSKRIHYVDVGTSGGIWGLERGYCMMIGGEEFVVERLDPIFSTLAPGAGTIPKTKERHDRDPRVENGYMHAGPVGAGHFVKMVHNGIEYGLMQAYAEGFHILRSRSADTLPEGHRYDVDLADVAEVWRRGSVITSWLLDLTSMALAEHGALDNFSGYVEDSGEGRWTVEAAIEGAVPANVLSAALYERFHSRIERSFADRLLSAMRSKFGGHVEGRPPVGNKS
ncbi:MAG: decarboxylating 6-phosphogluconate dehydrogenase [Alphaproteobacteria bacterium]|nr:decarboxylating 6-phosphogluconate dehydrogenase [Alphaproteobacteria bacterium]MDE2111156.1 decarboxylating 6-phosphogluconate dehydrogenase [Alphaproteobacteria bacterium]MDE2495974.1 decarboxylating 6-phosphogluconate dehydrogenase [Alphaproteobacteria bacterium]